MITIRYDPDGVFLKRGGISQAELAQLDARLAAARDDVMADAR